VGASAVAQSHTHQGLLFKPSPAFVQASIAVVKLRIVLCIVLCACTCVCVHALVTPSVACVGVFTFLSCAVNLLSAILGKGLSLFQEADRVAGANFGSEFGPARVLAVVNAECDRLASDILVAFMSSERVQAALAVSSLASRDPTCTRPYLHVTLLARDPTCT
jgi:hypothetical protein